MKVTKFTALRAPEYQALAWLGAGFAVPLLLRVAGSAAPAWYDQAILPALVVFVRPWLWVLWLTGLAAVAFRTERLRGGLACGCLALGITEGLLLGHHWWYEDPLWLGLPWCHCLTLGVIVWRLRLLAWSSGARVAAISWWVTGLTFLGMAWNWGAGFGWDNRFSLGLTQVANVLITGLVVGALAAGLGWWGLRHAAAATSQNRRRLVRLIEREPRCAEYFTAVTALTPLGPERRHWQRNWLPSVAELPPPPPAPPPVFRPGSDLLGPGWDRLLQDFYWSQRAGGLGKWCRHLRAAGEGPSFPSNYFRSLLTEGAQREYHRWLAAIGPGPEKTWLDRLPRGLLEPQPCMLADFHFVRYTALREALVEAEHGFLVRADPWSAEWVALRQDRFRELLRAAASPGASAAPLPEVRVDQQWGPVAGAYWEMWVQRVDRLFIMQGNPTWADAQAARLPELTRILLLTRPTGRVAVAAKDPPSEAVELFWLHEGAADLALGLLAVEPEQAREVAKLLRDYFAPNADRQRPAWWARQPAAAGLNAAVACAGYLLWRGLKEGWDEPLTTEPLSLPEFPIEEPIARRARAHTLAAKLLTRIRNQGEGGLADQDLATARWDDFLRLPNLPGAAEFPPVGADLLAAAFITHLDAALRDANALSDTFGDPTADAPIASSATPPPST